MTRTAVSFFIILTATDLLPRFENENDYVASNPTTVRSGVQGRSFSRVKFVRLFAVGCYGAGEENFIIKSMTPVVRRVQPSCSLTQNGAFGCDRNTTILVILETVQATCAGHFVRRLDDARRCNVSTRFFRTTLRIPVLETSFFE